MTLEARLLSEKTAMAAREAARKANEAAAKNEPSASLTTAKASAQGPSSANVTSSADATSKGADEEPVVPAVSGSVVDMDVFGQLLEIDDDDSHEFSKTLAFDYISQAETTFEEIASALKAKDLETLSRKGHFLKGSSAALGLQRVQHLCEAMQHTGAKKDGSGDGPALSEDVALKRCSALLDKLRTEQEAAKDWLEKFYKQK